MTYILDLNNWLNIYIYSDIDHVYRDIKNPITFNQWYFDKIRNLIGEILDQFENDIEILFFTQYISPKPTDLVIEGNFNQEEYMNSVQARRDDLRKIHGDISMPTRFIRWRFLIKETSLPSLNEIKTTVIDKINEFDDVFGYELVEYNVGADLGNRYCRTTPEWDSTNITQMKRLENFLKYWDGISRYTLSIITEDLKLDSQYVDVMGILHLGFNTLGTVLPFKSCHCGNVVVFNSSLVGTQIFCPTCGFEKIIQFGL